MIVEETSTMPFTDDEGDRVEKGEEVNQTRNISASAGDTTASVRFTNIHSVDEAYANFDADPANDADGINHVDTSFGESNQVQVVFAPGAGLNNDEDLTVTAFGY